MGIVIPRRTDPNTGQTYIGTEAGYDELVGRYDANQSFQNSFNQGIPGVTSQYGGYGGIPLPGRPAYSPPQPTAGTDLRLNGPHRTQGMLGSAVAGLLTQLGQQQQSQQGQQPTSNLQPALLSQQQQPTPFAPSGMYGRQAMQMAGVPGPDSYPNGLLGGGKGSAFRPGGK